jgi:hypothetical protein
MKKALIVLLILGLLAAGTSSIVEGVYIHGQSQTIASQVQTIVDQQGALAVANGTISSLRTDLGATRQELAVTSSVLVAAREDLDRRAQEIEQLQGQVDALTFGPITRTELLDFLARDPTNLMPYSFPGYDCKDYVIDLIIAAREAGWRVNAVWLDFQYAGHSIVRFDRAGGGYFYVEPQLDMLLSTPAVGLFLCAETGNDCVWDWNVLIDIAIIP